MYNTDKQAGGLLAHYERMFSHLRDTELKYLEIGILEGESLRWAKDFFRQGVIFGVDRKLPPVNFERTILFECDQSENEKLESFAKTEGNFDIIIDDASHDHDPTLQTFDIFWNHLNKGGWYIIEDWTAGYSDIPRFQGMVEVISEILLNKTKYNFTDILINSDKKSFAAFKK